MSGAVPYPGDATTGSARDLELDEEVRNRSVGELIGEISKDLGQLVHQEIELAKVEMKQEVTKVGRGAGMLGGAGFAGYMVAVFLSFMFVFLIGTFWTEWVGALIVALVWGAAGAVLYSQGKAQLKTVNGPVQTKETLKEDAQWVRHPTS